MRIQTLALMTLVALAPLGCDVERPEAGRATPVPAANLEEPTLDPSPGQPAATPGAGSRELSKPVPAPLHMRPTGERNVVWSGVDADAPRPAPPGDRLLGRVPPTAAPAGR